MQLVPVGFDASGVRKSWYDASSFSGHELQYNRIYRAEDKREESFSYNERRDKHEPLTPSQIIKSDIVIQSQSGTFWGNMNGNGITNI